LDGRQQSERREKERRGREGEEKQWGGRGTKNLPPPSRGLIAGGGQREGDFQILGASGIQQGWQRRIGGWLEKAIKINVNSKKIIKLTIFLIL
jgi:hypothetical protein